MQTKLESIKETFSQSILGVVIGLIAMRIMLSLLENIDKNTQSVVIVFVMFVLSTSRGYIVRRYFNKKSKSKKFKGKSSLWISHQNLSNLSLL